MAVIPDFQKKFADKTDGHNKYFRESKRIIQVFKAQVANLKQELETKTKSVSEFKNRDNAFAQNLKKLDD